MGLLKMSNFPQKENSRTTEGEPPCVKCGFCCHQAICCHGESDDNGMCVFLEIDDMHLGTFSCTLRSQIMDIEKGSPVPMFDNYCSSSMFNNFRDQVLLAMEAQKND